MLTVLLIVYCVLIAAVSYLGGWLPALVRLTHTRMQLVMSLVAGVMLGVAMLHLLPHGLHELQAGKATAAIDWAMRWTLAGLLTMFLLVRLFHVHHHGPTEADDEDAAAENEDQPEPAAGDILPIVTKTTAGDSAPDDEHRGHRHAPGESCGHAHSPHGHAHSDEPEIPQHAWAWIGLFFGLAVHTLIDGIALGASVRSEGGPGHGHLLAGAGTFLAIALHKPLDALSITLLMKAAGWPSNWQNVVNGCFALMCPLGALFFYLGADYVGDAQHLYIGGALAFSAGVFLCIALGDLLPELHFHHHDSWKLTAALLLGLAIAAALQFVEPAHLHDHDHNHSHAPGEHVGHSP